MKSNENIEQLFKDAFDNFEADVTPKAWVNIQSQIGVATKVAAGSGTGAAVGLSVGKIIAVSALVVTTATGIWYAATSEPTASTSSTNSVSVQTSSDVNTQNNNTATTSTESVKNSTSEPLAVKPNYSQSYQPSVDDRERMLFMSRSSYYGAWQQQDQANQTTPSVLSPLAPEDSKVTSVEPAKTSSGGMSTATEPKRNAATNSNAFASTQENNEATDHASETPIIHSDADVVDPSRLPNFFTPNGDGKNDVFSLKEACKNVKNLDVEVIDNNSGRVIFSWSGVESGWDGHTLNGASAKNGSYYFYYKAVGTDGRIVTGKGLFELKQ